MIQEHSNAFATVIALLLIQSWSVTATFPKVFGSSPKVLLAYIGNHQVIVPDLFGVCEERSWASWCIFPSEATAQASTTTKPPQEDNISDNEDNADNNKDNEDEDEMIVAPISEDDFVFDGDITTNDTDLAQFWLEDMCSSSTLIIDDPVQKRQLLALAKIYFHFDAGPNISTTTTSSLSDQPWLSNCEPCTWGGIGCNLEKQVAELVLGTINAMYSIIMKLAWSLYIWL